MVSGALIRAFAARSGFGRKVPSHCVRQQLLPRTNKGRAGRIHGCRRFIAEPESYLSPLNGTRLIVKNDKPISSVTVTCLKKLGFEPTYAGTPEAILSTKCGVLCDDGRIGRLIDGETGVRYWESQCRLRLKALTSRRRGQSLEAFRNELRAFVRGWVNYFKTSSMSQFVLETDEWLRRRIRQIYWKQWKKVRTKYAALRKLDVSEGKAWEWANTRKSYGTQRTVGYSRAR